MIELRTIFWVEALKRRAELGLAAFYVSRRGDEDSGAVLLKVVRSRTEATLYVPQRDETGARIWSRYKSGRVSEADIDAYCRSRGDDDPDLWIIEIEDREGRNFLNEPVEENS